MKRAPRRSCSLQARVLILGLLISLLTPAAWAQLLTGRVVGVTDGDTITVLDDQRVQHKIRLAGIDAPEKSQAFGQRSKTFLSSLVFSKPVVVETQKTDRYGRTVGKVLVGDRDANLALVVAGLAWHYKKYETEQSASDRMIYASAEQDARAARQGLWADPSAMQPPSARDVMSANVISVRLTLSLDELAALGAQRRAGALGAARRVH